MCTHALLTWDQQAEAARHLSRGEGLRGTIHTGGRQAAADAVGQGVARPAGTQAGMAEQNIWATWRRCRCLGGQECQERD